MTQSLIQRAKSTLVYSVSTISYWLFDLIELAIKTLCVIYVREAVVKFWGRRSHPSRDEMRTCGHATVKISVKYFYVVDVLQDFIICLHSYTLTILTQCINRMYLLHV